MDTGHDYNGHDDIIKLWKTKMEYGGNATKWINKDIFLDTCYVNFKIKNWIRIKTLQNTSTSNNWQVPESYMVHILLF